MYCLHQGADYVFFGFFFHWQTSVLSVMDNLESDGQVSSANFSDVGKLTIFRHPKLL
jgi:hypothetical protein